MDGVIVVINEILILLAGYSLAGGILAMFWSYVENNPRGMKAGEGLVCAAAIMFTIVIVLSVLFLLAVAEGS